MLRFVFGPAHCLDITFFSYTWLYFKRTRRPTLHVFVISLIGSNYFSEFCRSIVVAHFCIAIRFPCFVPKYPRTIRHAFSNSINIACAYDSRVSGYSGNCSVIFFKIICRRIKEAVNHSVKIINVKPALILWQQLTSFKIERVFKHMVYHAGNESGVCIWL